MLLVVVAARVDVEPADFAAGLFDDSVGRLWRWSAVAVAPGFHRAFGDAEQDGSRLVAGVLDVIGQAHGNAR